MFRELKLKRSIVAPNINFVSQLMKYDEERQRAKQNLLQSSITSFASNNRNDTSLADDSKSCLPQRVEFLNDMRCAADHDVVDSKNSFIKFQKRENGKDFTQRKISIPPTAKTPAVFPGGRLAAKRKLLIPLHIKLSAPSEGNPGSLIAASAPIISIEHNPFASAFKKANSECGEYSFATKMDALSE